MTLGPDDDDHALLNQVFRATSVQVMRLPHRKGRSRPEYAELRANAQVGAGALRFCQPDPNSVIEESFGGILLPSLPIRSQN